MINVSSFSERLQAGFQFAVDDGGFTLLGMTADSGFASIRPTGRSLVGFSPD